jgi:hypothetical protein
MLYKLWLSLIGGCRHKYKLIHEIDVVDKYTDYTNVIATKMVLQCESCGNIKVKRV